VEDEVVFAVVGPVGLLFGLMVGYSWLGKIFQKVYRISAVCQALAGWHTYTFLPVLKKSVRLAYQPPASSTFLSEQTSHR
jgi:hypothetical protein